MAWVVIVLPLDPVPLLVGLIYRVVQRMELRSREIFYTLLGGASPERLIQIDRCGKRQNVDIRRYDSVVVSFWRILLRDDSEGIEMRAERVDHP